MKIKKKNENYVIEFTRNELEDLYTDISCINDEVLPEITKNKYTSFIKAIEIFLRI